MTTKNQSLKESSLDNRVTRQSSSYCWSAAIKKFSFLWNISFCRLNNGVKSGNHEMYCLNISSSSSKKSTCACVLSHIYYSTDTRNLPLAAIMTTPEVISQQANYTVTCCSVRAPVLSWQLASRRHGKLARFGSASASCSTVRVLSMSSSLHAESTTNTTACASW